MNQEEKDLLRRLFESWRDFVDEHFHEHNMDWPQEQRDLAAEVESVLDAPTDVVR